MTYDAVVIGAGHNGLAAAIHLAAKGWKVAVVEKAPVAGGAIKTAEVTLPGFRHDLYAANLNLFAGSRFFARHKNRLLANGLEFVPASQCFASAFPDGSWLGVGTDLEETIARIGRFSAHDAEAWRGLAGAFLPQLEVISAILAARMPSVEILRIVGRAIRKLGMRRALDIAQLLVSSPRAFLDRHFESDVVKATIAPWAMHLDFPPDAAGGGLFPFLESLACQHFGMVFGRGGADNLVAALTGTLHELGGELLLHAEASRITLRDGRAESVLLADGRTLAARQAVIANLHPRVLFGRLLPDVASAQPAARRIAALRPGPATMMIHLALSALPAWRASEELRRFAYVHLAPSLGSLARAYEQAMDGMLPNEPMLVVGQPTAIDPSRAPAGQHVLWIQVRPLPGTIRGDAAGIIAATDWDAVRETYADRVLEIVERYAPGLRGQILSRAVLSPLYLERDNPNLVGGDSLSGSHQLDQNFLFRPAPGWSRYKTPLRRLYMVGASTWPGAGVGAGSGYILARALAGN